jgi:hypothetical protein
MWNARFMWNPGDNGSWNVPNFNTGFGCSATPGGFPGKGFCYVGDDELLGWSQYE